jgi:hypothetical protein
LSEAFPYFDPGGALRAVREAGVISNQSILIAIGID